MGVPPTVLPLVSLNLSCGHTTGQRWKVTKYKYSTVLKWHFQVSVFYWLQYFFFWQLLYDKLWHISTVNEMSMGMSLSDESDKSEHRYLAAILSYEWQQFYSFSRSWCERHTVRLPSLSKYFTQAKIYFLLLHFYISVQSSLLDTSCDWCYARAHHQWC